MPDYPINHGGGSRDNGGTRRFLEEMARGGFPRWTWTPELEWSCTILAADLAGAHATQRATITLDPTGIGAGRLTATFTGYGLAAPVSVTADLAHGGDENDLGDALEQALDTAIAGSLSAVLASVNNDGASNVLDLVFVAGIARGAITLSFADATVIELQFGGTNLVDGDYTATFTGGGLGAAVPITITRGGGVATLAELAAAAEAAIEAEAENDLRDVVVSADDDTVDTAVVRFEPGIAASTITTAVPAFPQAFDATFGGTETDGTYRFRFDHSSLPSPVDVDIVRAAGTPATNADLAAQAESQLEANLQLIPLLASANDNGAVSEVRTYAGVTGLTLATSAPSPGTLNTADVSDGPTFTATDATGSYDVSTAVSYSTAIDLNGLSRLGRFPHHVLRRKVALEVVAAFGANRTITIGDAADPDGIFGSTPITINTTGRSLAVAADAQYASRYEAELVPVAIVDLGSSSTVSTGKAVIQIRFMPAPCAEGSAA